MDLKDGWLGVARPSGLSMEYSVLTVQYSSSGLAECNEDPLCLQLEVAPLMHQVPAL